MPWWSSYQRIFATHVFIGKGSPIIVDQVERAADFGFSDPLGLVCDSFPVQPSSLFSEIEYDSGAGDEEKHTCFECQGLARGSA